MTTYYISPNGSDSNNGLGPDASDSTNKPWLTVGKSMNTGSPLNAGDTVYIAPGYYYSEALVPIATISSAGSPTQWIGDPTNAQGFKDGSGVLRAPGQPWITTRTSGEGLDGTLASATGALLVATTNSPSGLQFSKVRLEANYLDSNTTRVLQTNWATGSDYTFSDCVLSASLILGFPGTGAATAGRNITFSRCILLPTYGVFQMISSTAAATADANLGIHLLDCLIMGPVAQSGSMAPSAAGGNIAGGINITSCVLWETLLLSTASRVSTVNPITITGCLLKGRAGTAILNAGTSGQIIDGGYNRILGGQSFTNVTLAGTSLLNVAFNLVLPHLVTWGLEMPRADFLGWTDAAATTQKFSASGIVTADFRGRTVRPWGSGASIGYMQAQDVTQDTASAITGGGTNSLKLTGAGEVSLWIPVDASGFTVSVTTKSTSYGGSNYPQLIVVANPSVGVTSDTTVTASSASEQEITTATITPTSQGVMEVRLVSRSSSTSSTTHFDLLATA